MKTLKVSDATHARMLSISQSMGFSVDTILNQVFQRVTDDLTLYVGHCAVCKKRMALSWDQLDTAINKAGFYHTGCEKDQETSQESA